LLEEDSQVSRRADRRGGQCTVRVAIATGALIWGNGLGSLRRSYKSPTTDRSRGRHPRLQPLKRLLVGHNHGGLAPNRPHASHESETPPHAMSENAQQLLAYSALHRGNTFWKN
jgi:hypothetical protein